MLVAGDPADRHAPEGRVGAEGRGRHPAEAAAGRVHLGAGWRPGTPKSSPSSSDHRRSTMSKRGCGRRWWRRWRTPRRRAPGEVPQDPGVDGARRPGRRGRPAPRPRRAASASWSPRSRGRGPGRSAPGPWGGGRPRSSSRQRPAVRRSCQTMARWRGRPVRRSQATTVSRWLVMPMARATRPWSAQPTGHLVQGGAHGVPDLVGVVLHPAGAREVLGELAVGDVDHPGPVVHHQGPDPGGPGVDGDGHGGAGGHTRTVVTAGAPRTGAVRPRMVLATSNHLQFFASSLRAGNSRPATWPNRKKSLTGV